MSYHISIISGGTATNELVPLFSALASKISYILPISDNGGSTSELIRVIGGPAIGDIRSRLNRLIPNNSLRELLSYRLSSDPTLARYQWNEIIDGTHPIWLNISPTTKEIFRSFLIHLHVELLKRSKFSSFRYELANIGNLFITGLRLFIGSLDSAIELFSKLTQIDSSIEVLPCINTNFSYHISALLLNGLIITGQSQISHPSDNQNDYPPPIHKSRSSSPPHGDVASINEDISDLEGRTIASALDKLALSGELSRLDSGFDLKDPLDSDFNIKSSHSTLNSGFDVQNHTSSLNPRFDMKNPSNMNSVFNLKSSHFSSDIKHPSNLDQLHSNYPSNLDLLHSNTLSSNPLHISVVSPTETTGQIPTLISTAKMNIHENQNLLYLNESDDEETGNTPQYIHPELKKSQLHFNKTNIQPLLSPIKRIFYISPYGEEICPMAHSRATNSIANSNAVIYSIGSLMTSIVPVIILRGIGRALASDIDKQKKKILLLNGSSDRETFGMSAIDFVKVIADLAIYSLQKSNYPDHLIQDLKWSDLVTHLIFMKDSKIPVDVGHLEGEGIRCVEVQKIEDTDFYDPQSLEQNLRIIFEQQI